MADFSETDKIEEQQSSVGDLASTRQEQEPVVEEQAQPVEQSSDDGYVPVFSAKVRTIIYVLGVVSAVILIVLAALSTDLGWPKWAVDLIAVLGPVLPGIASAFGVHYAGISK